MPRPRTKEDLMIAAKENYEKLDVLITKLSDEELSTTSSHYDWAMKKLKAHQKKGTTPNQIRNSSLSN